MDKNPPQFFFGLAFGLAIGGMVYTAGVDIRILSFGAITSIVAALIVLAKRKFSK